MRLKSEYSRRISGALACGHEPDSVHDPIQSTGPVEQFAGRGQTFVRFHPAHWKFQQLNLQRDWLPASHIRQHGPGSQVGC